MATYYVDGTGAGSNSYNGQAAVFASGTTGPKATVTAGEALLAAGDLLHIRPASYYEKVTLGVSGTAGNFIEMRGDYAGAVWPSTAGQVVRITGAASNNQSISQTAALVAVTKNYRKFKHIAFDSSTGALINCSSGCTYFTFDDCFFGPIASGQDTLECWGAGQSNFTISNCFFWGANAASGVIYFQHSAAVDNCAHVVESCTMIGSTGGTDIRTDRIGGITVRNCTLYGGTIGIRVAIALTGGQVLTANNNIVAAAATGLSATTTAEFTEDYNNLASCGTNRSNVTAGANSKTYPYLPDMRWWFAGAAGGTLVTPFSLASYNALVELNSGTGAPSTDWRGHAASGSFREWGAEEYVSTYTSAAGSGVTMWPLSNSFIGAILGGDM